MYLSPIKVIGTHIYATGIETHKGKKDMVFFLIPYSLFIIHFLKGDTAIMGNRKHWATCLLLPFSHGVIVRGKTWGKDKGGNNINKAPPLTPLEQTQQEYKYKRWTAERKRNKKMAYKEALKLEKNGDVDRVREYCMRNNAGIRHIATFYNLAKHGEDNGKCVCICSFVKRLSLFEVKKEWSTISKWCGKNINDESVCALSIGAGSNGWYGMRFICVGEQEQVFNRLCKVWGYLIRKRQWKSKAVHMTDETVPMLDHYLGGNDWADWWEKMLPEVWALYKASLLFGHRTFKSEGAKTILEQRAKGVTANASLCVYDTQCYKGATAGNALCEVGMRGDYVNEACPLLDEGADNEGEFYSDDDEEF